MTESTLTWCRCTASQTACGSNFGKITAVSPPNRHASVATMAAPWMSGAGAMRTMPLPPGARAGLRPLVLERLAGDEVDAAAERAPDVLMAPHDALRLPGGAAGVDDVDVIGAARAEVAGAGLRRERLGVVPADHDARQPGGRDGIDDRRQVLVVDEDGQAGVFQVVRQLLRQVPVVDVDHHGPELDRGEQRRHGLDGVAGVQADVAAGADALGGQVVREAVGLVLEPAVGDLAVAADQRDPLGEGVDGMLEQVGHVQRHG